MRSSFGLLVWILLAAGCTDNPFATSDVESGLGGLSPTAPALRHPHLVDLGSAGKGAQATDHVFVGFATYEPDGITRRVLDTYGVTRRILSEYGVTRRVLDGYGVSRRVLDEYGITSTYLTSYSQVLDVLVLASVPLDLVPTDGDVTVAIKLAGASSTILEANGISRRVLEEYAITRRILDKYGVTDTEFAKAFQNWERTVKLKARIDASRPGMFVSLGSLTLETFLAEIASDPDIEFVERDITLDMAPLGTLTKSTGGAELIPWGVTEVGGGHGTGGDTHVYLLDSGVEMNDLNVVERSDFSYLFKDRDQLTWDDSAELERPVMDMGFWIRLLTSGNSAGDVSGHGTHLAGIIGAIENNDQVVGVAPGAKIHSLRVMTESGQTDITTLVTALDYISVVKTIFKDRRMVVNLSLGMNLGSRSYNVLDEAVERLIEMGVTVVVSAGNDGADASLYSPAHVAEAITVGSYSQQRAYSRFSNWGSVVDFSAPGELIGSLSHDPSDAASNIAVVESGTSQAAAHVTGLVAQYLNANPTAQPADVAAALAASAKDGVLGLPSGTTDRAAFLDTSQLEPVMDSSGYGWPTTSTPTSGGSTDSSGDSAVVDGPTVEDAGEQPATNEDDVSQPQPNTPAADSNALSTTSDSFADLSYTGSDGDAAWATEWIEGGETNGPLRGKVRVRSSSKCFDSNCLAITGTKKNRSLERSFDLSGAPSAELSVYLDPTDLRGAKIKLEISRDGGSSWETLEAFSSRDGARVRSYDLGEYLGATTTIRFRTSRSSEDAGRFYADNVVISRSR